MSGDIQPRKRKGKGRKKDEADNDVADVKSNSRNGTTNHAGKHSSSSSSSSGDGSGIVAKIIFIVLLVSLIIVIGLILVELQGKQAGLKDRTPIIQEAEDSPLPPPVIYEEEEDLPVPEAPAPTLQQELEEEVDVEPTPPLEEYIHVAGKVVQEAPPIEPEAVPASEQEEVEAAPVEEVVEVVEEVIVEVPVEEEVKTVEEPEATEEPVVEPEAVVVEEVVEVVEEVVPVEEVVEIVEVEVPPEEEVAAEIKEEVPPVEEVIETVEEPVQVEPEIIEITEEIPAAAEEAVPAEEDSAPEEETVLVEEALPVESVSEEVQEEVLPQEDVPVEAEEVTSEETAEEPVVAEAAEEIVEEPVAEVVEEPVAEAAEEVVEEPVAEAAEEVVEEPVAEVVEEPVAEVVEEPVVEPVAAEASEEIVEEPVVVEAAEVVDAPLENIAETVSEDKEDEEEDDEDDEDKDDEEEVADLKLGQSVEPEDDEEDWSQYGREAGAGALTDAYLRVESLAEEVLSLDPENAMVAQLSPHLAGVLRAMEDGRTEGLLDTLSHIQVILEDVKTRISQPKAAGTPEQEEATDPELVVDVGEPESVAVETEPLAADEPVAEPAAPEEPQSEPQAAEPETDPVLVDVEDSSVEAEPLAAPVVDDAPADLPSPLLQEEETSPLEVSAEAASEPESIPPEVVADIEAQIIPHEEAIGGSSAPAVEVDIGDLPSPVGEEGQPVPVEEVIPDPIHIEPLQEETKPSEQPPSNEKADINSQVDDELREELDAAEDLLSRNPRDALNRFGAILHHNPKSARALYGRAQSLDQLAEAERSNSKLEQAIVTYRGVIDLADENPELVPLPLLRKAAEKCIERMRFRGFMGKAVRVQQRLLQRFPDDKLIRNQMGVTFLLMNQPSAAKEVFQQVLERWPDDGFAQVHYGFIMKTTFNNNTEGAKFMLRGIQSRAEGTQDGRFFLHLGDALQREGKVEEAYQVYDEAVEKKLFLNRYQRSLYNVDRLFSQPFWTLEETTYQEFFRKLEENWQLIKQEGLSVLAKPVQDGFRPESENLQDTGDWKQYELFSRGRKITANCVSAPITCSLIETFPPSSQCKRGQVKFSVMEPNTHVHAHTGPTNCRLRAHLGLVIPSGPRLRVGSELRYWQEGKVLVFDDSWEHEVWHEGDSMRLLLIVDVWHPELTDQEKKTLSSI